MGGDKGLGVTPRKGADGDGAEEEVDEEGAAEGGSINAVGGWLSEVVDRLGVQGWMITCLLGC